MKSTVSMTIDVQLLAEVQARVGKGNFSSTVEDLIKSWLDQFKDKKKTMDDFSKNELKARITALTTEVTHYRKRVEEMEEKQRKDEPMFIIGGDDDR